MGAGPQGFGAPPPTISLPLTPGQGGGQARSILPASPRSGVTREGRVLPAPGNQRGIVHPRGNRLASPRSQPSPEAGSSLCVHGLLSCPSTTSWALREPWCCKPRCPSAPLQEGPTSGLAWPKVGEHPCRAPVPPQHLPCSRRGDAGSSEHRPGGRGRGDASSTAPEQETGRGGLWLLGAW